jgi:hypothetical protein
MRNGECVDRYGDHCRRDLSSNAQAVRRSFALIGCTNETIGHTVICMLGVGSSSDEQPDLVKTIPSPTYDGSANSCKIYPKTEMVADKIGHHRMKSECICVSSLVTVAMKSLQVA